MIAGLEEVSSGPDLPRRPRHHQRAAAAPRHRDGVPELRAVSADDGAQEHGVRAPDAWHGARRARQAGDRGRRDARPRGSARAAPGGAVGRAAPARRDGPGDRPRAARVPHGRAAVEPRRQAPGHRARAAHPAPPAARRHHGVRHPRPDRGDDARPARRRAARRAAAAVRHAAGAVPRAGQPVRRRVHRLAVDELRRRAGRRRRPGPVRRPERRRCRPSRRSPPPIAR